MMYTCTYHACPKPCLTLYMVYTFLVLPYTECLSDIPLNLLATRSDISYLRLCNKTETQVLACIDISLQKLSNYVWRW